MIEDKLPDSSAVVHALNDTPGTRFVLEPVGRFSEGLERLYRDRTKPLTGSERIAAIIVDLFLPDAEGIEVVHQLLQEAPYLPILVIANLPDENLAKLAVRHGAQDYLLKTRLDRYSLNKVLESMVDRAANAEALFAHKELAQVTLNSIGEAVLSVALDGAVIYLNPVAESLTGWRGAEAAGHPVEEVLNIVDGSTRIPVSNPLFMAMKQNKALSLTPHCVLIRRDGSESGIEDSAAPIHDRNGLVTGAVMVFHDVTQARALALRTSYLAQHDTLSGLANRAMLHDRLSHAITAANRHREKLAVLFIDVDRFKQVNDFLGHSVGDRLLQAMAQRLVTCLRDSDTAGRFGGDEFVVVLSEVAHSADAAIIADKLLVTLSQPYTIDAHSLHITVSIGIATFPDDGLDAELLLKNADVAMYHAKDGGRNQQLFYARHMNRRAGDRQILEGDLRRAIAQQEFVLHYQPKVDLQTGQITGVESLIRWRHPAHGLVPAAPFIRVAEQCGLIVPIGRWVLREACRQARDWLDAGLPLIQISVNTSALELTKAGFVENVRATLLAFNLTPRTLELELTETYLAQEPEVIEAVLQELKSLGVRLAFDDFGTGYASLTSLRTLPVDALKIDQSFVRNVASGTDDAAIVIAMITMGRSLHLRVVAEGVETRQQLEFLLAHGCPEGQGHYFSRPVSADEFAVLMGRRFAVGTLRASDPPAQARITSVSSAAG
ncbi:MAG TPA: EAL domain-containing protein [Steroidobacteraceae bacterium]|nr:EAL domain-containing protein [Steroidobacteraceae bacterium]